MSTHLAHWKRYLLAVCFGLMGASVCEAAYQGPTDNLTKVANAVEVRFKSLTTIVQFKPGLAVTQPVDISVGYYSPAGSYRVTQTYSPGSGNRFLYGDNEGEGQTRHFIH